MTTKRGRRGDSIWSSVSCIILDCREVCVSSCSVKHISYDIVEGEAIDSLLELHVENDSSSVSNASWSNYIVVDVVHCFGDGDPGSSVVPVVVVPQGVLKSAHIDIVTEVVLCFKQLSIRVGKLKEKLTVCGWINDLDLPLFRDLILIDHESLDLTHLIWVIARGPSDCDRDCEVGRTAIIVMGAFNSIVLVRIQGDTRALNNLLLNGATRFLVIVSIVHIAALRNYV